MLRYVLTPQYSGQGSSLGPVESVPRKTPTGNILEVYMDTGTPARGRIEGGDRGSGGVAVLSLQGGEHGSIQGTQTLQTRHEDNNENK